MHGIADTGPTFPRPSLFPVPPERALYQQRELKGAGLAEALVCETHLAALQTATVTSAINALRHSGRLADPQAMWDFIPHHTPMLLASRAWLDEAGLSAVAIEAIETFFAELKPARHHLAQMFADAAAIGWPRSEVLHLRTVTDGWRSASGAATAAIRQLDDELRYTLPERYAETVPVLSSLLNSARDGLQPCIDAAGRPFMPELPQRRRASRKGLFHECVVQHARRTVRAMVRDVSSGGLGLDGVEGLNPHDLVVVELASGRRLTGLVVWSKGRLAGVRLSTSLPPNDPLLYG